MVVDTQRRRRATGEVRPEAVDLRTSAKRIATLSTFERSKERARILAFLREHVSLTRMDELLLYPEVRQRVGEDMSRASLGYDRLAIRHWMELLAAADVTDTARLQSLLIGLDALVRVQMWKENELRLATVEPPLPVRAPLAVWKARSARRRMHRCARATTR